MESKAYSVEFSLMKKQQVWDREVAVLCTIGAAPPPQPLLPPPQFDISEDETWTMCSVLDPSVKLQILR